MKQTSKKLWSILLSLALMLSLVPAFSMTALAADNVSTYNLVIPSTLNVSTAGWNATSGLTAAVTSGDTFDTSKKLAVTAASTNGWSLKSGDNSVGYNLATADGTYSSTATPASWEFTAAELNASGGMNKAMGIIVDDYSSKPAGSYTDTVTFTASVEDAAKAYALGGQPINNGTVIKVNFKWRGQNSGDYVQGTYNADSGTFTASKGGTYWGSDKRAVYKFDKNENLITVGAGYYDYEFEGMQWTFNTETDTYSYTKGNAIDDDMYGLISVIVDGVDVTNKLTQQ
ncbi:MAG: hypothetical protein IKS78_09375 [Clostridia bacterium]|nr:hypothetical protein [Clostridia bacterium]